MLLLTVSVFVILNLQYCLIDAASIKNVQAQSQGVLLLKNLLQEIMATKPLDNIQRLNEQILNSAKSGCDLSRNPEMCRIQELYSLWRALKVPPNVGGAGKVFLSGYDDVASGATSQAAAPSDSGNISPNRDGDRNEISVLKNILNVLDHQKDRAAASTIKKRTCRVRLGGHCNTEALDKAAKSYYYLKSGDSPGKRRRRSLRSVLINPSADV